MKDFIKNILDKYKNCSSDFDPDNFFEKSSLLKYLDLKTDAILGNTKTRRNLANIYAIYAILNFYSMDSLLMSYCKT